MTLGSWRYYDHELSVEDYFLSHGQEPGVWVGSGAAVLGLDGTVEEDQLARLFDEGCHPVSGAPLGVPYRHDSKRTVVTGFALSFSPPESVSLLGAFGDAEVAAEVRGLHANIMRRSSAEISATETLRHELDRAEDPATLRRLHEHARAYIDTNAGPDRRLQLHRLQRRRGDLFACLLVGQPTLRRRLKLGGLAALDQRIALRYHLDGMDLEETAGYLRHNLALAGRSDPLFSDDAIALIHQTARGLPRAVNNLAIQALVAAFADGKTMVDESSAKAAVTEMTSE